MTLFVVLMLVSSLVATSLTAVDDEEPTLFDNVPTDDRLDELAHIASEIAKIQPNKKSRLSLRDVRALKEIEKRVKPHEYKLVWELYDEIVENRSENGKDDNDEKVEEGKLKEKPEPQSNHEPRKHQPMEEVHVIGSPFVGVPEHPDRFSVEDIYYMRAIRAEANNLYGEGNYADAYPLLLELARRGFKDSQSRLAYILFNGTEGVPKSNYRALGWLSAAANGRTEPIFRVLFNRYLREVPDENRDTVDAVIAGYQEEFGFPEHVKCSTNHRFNHSRSRVKKTYCEFKLEKIANACQGQCWAHKVNVVEEG